VIAEAGLAALWRGGRAGGIATGARLRAGRPQGREIGTVRAVALAQGLLTLFAFGALIAVFLGSDMSVLLVAENSHSQKPWLYKFAGAWGIMKARCCCG
jgi:cytochrome c-type biogenesis protein CcmF